MVDALEWAISTVPDSTALLAAYHSDSFGVLVLVFAPAVPPTGLVTRFSGPSAIAIISESGAFVKHFLCQCRVQFPLVLGAGTSSCPGTRTFVRRAEVRHTPPGSGRRDRATTRSASALSCLGVADRAARRSERGLTRHQQQSLGGTHPAGGIYPHTVADTTSDRLNVALR